jgi:2-oxoglutarate ferredoxin oxidoreductase subunit delta
LSFGELFNKGGYKAVVVDEGKCIQCGTCYTVCPDVVFEFTEEKGGDK